MFKGEEKYYDKNNLEDLLQATLSDPDVSSQLWESMSDLDSLMVDLEKRWDKLQEKINKAQMRSSKSTEDETGKDNKVSEYLAEQKQLAERLEQAKKRKDQEQRVLNEYYERIEKVEERIEKNKQRLEKILVQDKLQKMLKDKSDQELLELHFDTLKRDKSLPSRQLMLNATDEEILKRQNMKGNKRLDQQEKENKGGGIPGPTRRSEEEDNEENLMDFYLSNRRAAQTIEGPELLKLWVQRTEAVERPSSTLKDFLHYKAAVNEIIARYRIAERGSLE